MKVRPLEHTVHPFFGKQFVNAHLRDVPGSPSTDDFLAFVHVHNGHVSKRV